MIRSALRAAAVAALVVACTTTRPPKPPAPAIAAAPPDTSGWLENWPKTWTDPRVVAALASDCAFDPKLTPPDDGQHDTPPDMFRCKVAYAQSCVPDLCFSGDCEESCTSSCLDCSGTCTSSCNACKSACKDVACRETCAEQCAQCKHACIGKLDHCTSADCRKVHAECDKRMTAAWKKAGCATKCRRWLACTEACDSKKGKDTAESCSERCANAASPGFQKCSDRCEAAKDQTKWGACMTDCYISEPCSPFGCNAMYTTEEVMRKLHP